MAEEVDELADFKVSNVMKQAFNKKSDLSSFWLSLHDSYSVLRKKAPVMFVQFSTTYLCETGFSDLVTIRTKFSDFGDHQIEQFRNCLDARNDIRLAQSKTEPNLKVSSNEDKNKLRTDCVNKTNYDVSFFDISLTFVCLFFHLNINRFSSEKLFLQNRIPVATANELQIENFIAEQGATGVESL